MKDAQIDWLERRAAARCRSQRRSQPPLHNADTHTPCSDPHAFAGALLDAWLDVWLGYRALDAGRWAPFCWR